MSKKRDPFNESKLIFSVINSIFLITILVNYIRENLNEVCMECMAGSSKLPQKVISKISHQPDFWPLRAKSRFLITDFVFLKIVRKVRKMSHNLFYYCYKKLTLA